MALLPSLNSVYSASGHSPVSPLIAWGGNSNDHCVLELSLYQALYPPNNLLSPPLDLGGSGGTKRHNNLPTVTLLGSGAVVL